MAELSKAISEIKNGAKGADAEKFRKKAFLRRTRHISSKNTKQN
jgi:hypothetical protein